MSISPSTNDTNPSPNYRTYPLPNYQLLDVPESAKLSTPYEFAPIDNNLLLTLANAVLWRKEQEDQEEVENPWENFDLQYPSWDANDSSDDSWHSCPTKPSSQETSSNEECHVSNGNDTDNKGSSNDSTSTTQWDIPNRRDHAEIDNILTYIIEKWLPDYTCLRLISQCTPANDLTRLCQHLCIDSAAQRFSGEVQMMDFDYQDLEELFYSLE